MKIEAFISWRYLATKRKEKFISLISVISVLGVAIGVMALIVVIAVMSGFDQDLRDKIAGNYSHITIAGYSGIKEQEYSGISEKASRQPHVTGLSPYVQGQLLLKENNRFFAVNLKGIDRNREPSVTKIARYLKAGDLSGLTDDGVIVGSELANYLGLRVGSSLVTYSGVNKQRTLKVEGIFSSGMYDYDMNLAFTTIRTAQEMLGMDGLYTAVAVKLDNLYFASPVRDELNKALGFNYILKTWEEVNQNFFAALKLEKLTMFIILTLIILVASFNIASTLIVMVVEKTKDIGILKAIGMTSSRVRRIFIWEGLIIGSLGTTLGTAGGMILCGLLKKYQFIKLPQDIYYIEKLPVYIEFWPDIVLIIASAIAITLVSTIYPAAKAARLRPVEALRYE